MRMSETDKVYLKHAFKEMLEKGESCCTVETMEVDWEHGCDVRKLFRLIIESGTQTYVGIQGVH